MFIGRTDAEAEAPILWLLIEKANALEKTLMLGKIEDGRRRGRQGWNGWMASPTLRTWVWAKLWETVKDREAGVLQALGSQRARHDWVTEQQPPFILSGRRKKKKKNTSYMHQVHTPFKPHSITREKVPALSEITGSLPWKRPVMLEWERRMGFLLSSTFVARRSGARYGSWSRMSVWLEPSRPNHPDTVAKP